MKKYEILKDEFITLNNENTLYRIRACKDIKVSPTITIHKGDIGGYIECEANLEQKGNCWVSGDAWVYGNAEVCENAKVYGDAMVCETNEPDITDD